LYTPREDTFFLAENLKNVKGDLALDIGTGTGYLAKILSSQFSFVVGTDIDYNSLKNQKPKMRNLICCQGANALKCKFDLIVCNMPYLPSDDVIDQTIDGGREGIEIPFQIIKSALDRIKKNGRFLFITSSLANYQKLINKTQTLGFNVNIIAKKKLFFEELILVEVGFEKKLK
jgi:release factor glutamine methyltransferase